MRRMNLLTILFSGYLYHHDPPKGAFATITNYQNFISKTDDAEAWDQFSVNYMIERRPLDVQMPLVFGVGNYSVVENSDMLVLKNLLVNYKPPHAITQKAIELIRDMSERPKSNGTIGKQITSIVLPRDLTKNFDSDYHSSVNKSETYMADTVILRGRRGDIALKDITIPSEVIPKVKGNHPCPCKSGKKYKFCHGK